MLKVAAVKENGGGVDRMTENSMVSTSDPMPAPRVMLTSLTDDTNGDDAAYWVQDLFKVLEEPG